MFNEWYKPDACLEFPRGGSQAIVNALVRCAGPACTHLCNVPCSLSAKGRHLVCLCVTAPICPVPNAASDSEERIMVDHNRVSTAQLNVASSIKQRRGCLRARSMSVHLV